MVTTTRPGDNATFRPCLSLPLPRVVGRTQYGFEHPVVGAEKYDG